MPRKAVYELLRKLSLLSAEDDRAEGPIAADEDLEGMDAERPGLQCIYIVERRRVRIA